MRGQSIFHKIYILVYPFVIYVLVITFAMSLAQMLFGSDDAHYVICQSLASLITIPVLYFFYREDVRQDRMQRLLYAGMELPGDASEASETGGRSEAETAEKSERSEADAECAGGWRQIACFVLVGAGIILLLSFALNNLILMSPLPELSAKYQEVSDKFFSSSLGMELIGSAVMAPVLEELLYRGILCKRLKTMMPAAPAILFSSVFFGLMHMNLVQFTYAFLIGIVLAMFMELSDGLYLSIAGHICANALAVFRTELHILEWSMNKSLAAWGVSFAALAAGVALLIFFTFRCRKNGARKKV